MPVGNKLIYLIRDLIESIVSNIEYVYQIIGTMNIRTEVSDKQK